MMRGIRLSVPFFLALAVTAPVQGQAGGQRVEDPEEEPIQLQGLVVTASGFEQLRINAPASITVIEAKVVGQQRNNNLAELLANVEGIDIGDGVGKTGGPTISLRGMPSDYTLVLIDGRRQNTPGSVTPNGFGETSTSFLPPASAIERVEIIRGPMATLYGSDAMGGVINIITKKGEQQWRGSFSSDATLQQREGFGNTFAGSGQLDGPIVRNLLNLAVRGSLTHRNPSELEPTGEFGENTTISRRGPSPVESDVYTVGGRLTLLPAANHEVWLDADVSRQVYDNSVAQLGTLDNPNGTPPTFNGYGPEQKFNRDQAALAHTWRLARGQLSSTFSWNNTETIGRTIPVGTPGGPPGSGAPNKTPGSARELHTTNLIADSKLVLFNGNHVTTVGGQYWDAEMVDGVALDPFSFEQWSLFAENEWRFIPSMGLTLGVRRDDHSTFGAQVTPRAYLVWNATDLFTFKGGVSRGYKTPRLEQLVDGITGFGGQGRIALIGTPTLKPETSTSTEVGIYFANQAGAIANVTVFNNMFQDKITSGTPVPNCSFEGAPNLPGCYDYGNFPTQESFGQSVNVDEAVTRGIEFGGSVPISFLTLNANYTYTESEQKSGANEGMPLTNTPKHMVNGNLRADPTDRLSGWVRGEYRSSRARRLSTSTNAAFDALGDYKAYSLFHLGGSYQVARNLALSATVYNVLNTDFLQYASYPVTPTASNPSGIAYTNIYNNHQEGRRLWVSTTISF